MNISDFIEAGNPEDEEGILWMGQDKKAAEKPILKGKTGFNLSRNTLTVLIILVSSVASFGLGLLTGQGSAGNGAGLVSSSVPMTNPTLSTSALNTSAATTTSSAISGSKNASAFTPPTY